jgi:hypothetical protein
MSDNDDKGRDVGWATAQGEMRPIREVIRSRRDHHAAQPRATREAAYRERAFQQVMLATCLCCFPLIKVETPTGHEEWCPAHAMWLSSQEVKRIAALRASGEMTP